MSDGTVLGVSWGSFLLGILNLLVGGLLVAIVKSRPALKKIANEREANLLSERAEEMERMRERMDDLEKRLELSNEEIRVLRHDLANANQALDLFIALIEANPEKAAEHAARVKTQREAARASIAEEKRVVQQARVARVAKK